MDPKTNLVEQLRLASSLQWQIVNNRSVSGVDILRLTVLVIALDEWQRNGGFSPYAK